MTARLRRHLWQPFVRRMTPLVALAALAVALVLPVSYHVVASREQQARGELLATQLATELRALMWQRPVLWRYDSIKLLQASRPYLGGGEVAQISVVDRKDGALLARVGDRGRHGGQQVETPLILGGEAVATLRLSLTGRQVWTRALGLGLFSTFFAVLLGALLFGVPARTVRRAERELVDLVEALEDARDGLEDEVARRSADLRQAMQRLEELSRRLIGMQDAERARIARDLHDAVGQTLTGARLALESSEAGKPERLARLREVLDGAIGELRQVITQMRPPALEAAGLAAALDQLVRECDQRGKLAARFEGGIDPEPTEVIGTACYRILQEALSNAERHSGASELVVTLSADAEALRLEIRDDGCGFDPAHTREGGLGLLTMRERAEQLGGKLILNAAPQAGTLIEVSLPRS